MSLKSIMEVLTSVKLLRKSRWFEKKIPNISQTLRSHQAAESQLSQSHVARYTRRKYCIAVPMQMICESTCGLASCEVYISRPGDSTAWCVHICISRNQSLLIFHRHPFKSSGQWEGLPQVINPSAMAPPTEYSTCNNWRLIICYYTRLILFRLVVVQAWDLLATIAASFQDCQSLAARNYCNKDKTNFVCVINNQLRYHKAITASWRVLHLTWCTWSSWTTCSHTPILYACGWPL